jgi:chromosomal replication initiator protein
MGDRVTIELIANAVADVWGVSVADLRGPRRFHSYVDPRHVAFALAYKLTQHSVTVIGRWFGDRDHTTVLNGMRRFDVVLSQREREKIDHAESLIDQRRRAVFVRSPVMAFRSVRGEA